jgi:hypothetical protein
MKECVCVSFLRKDERKRGKSPQKKKKERGKERKLKRAPLGQAHVPLMVCLHVMFSDLPHASNPLSPPP